MGDVILQVTEPEVVLVVQESGEVLPQVVINEVAEVVIQREGIPGPRGLDLTLDQSFNTFIWSPPSAQSIWVVAHNREKYPSVTVVDGSGEVVIPAVKYLDANLVEITFAFPTTGTAYLN